MSETNIRQYIKRNELSVIKLHLGCGGIKWKDFINVDLHPRDPSILDSSRSGCVADVFADIRHLDLDDNIIDEIFTSHTIDHFTRWQVIEMLTDWHRMLKPKGILIIEVADFNRCILWLIHPNRVKRELARNQFYGNQWDRIDFETHRYVWSAKELQSVLYKIGFASVRVNHKTWTHYPGRDMHIEAIK